MNKKLKISIVAMAMVFVLLIGNILAYFTDADTATNEFTTGRISIDLQEPNWDPSLGGELVPGYEIPKDPQVLNDGINDAFIFVTVEVPYQSVTTTDENGNKLQPTDTELFSYDVKEGWIQVGDPIVDVENGVVKYVYAYAQDEKLTPLEPGNTTPTVFDFIQFEDVIEDEGLEETKLDVVVKAYGIQTDNIDGGKTSPEDVWPIVKNANGPIALEDIVIDFGLPVEIPSSQLGKDPIIEELSYATYGTVEIDGDSSKGDFTVTYTPTEILQGIDTVHLLTEKGKEYTFNVYPATTVYYEEGFVSNWNGNWENKGSKGSGIQELQIMAINDDNYGYTNAYKDNIGASSGTQAISKTGGEKAEFTFTGTGVDIYANCDPNTSIVAIMVYNANTNRLEKFYQINTKTKSGTSGATEGQNIAQYSLPIASIMDLSYGNYKVVLQHTKSSSDTEKAIMLDGFRIYNTLENSSVYNGKEQFPSFVEFRNEILSTLGITDINNTMNDQIFEQIENKSKILLLGINMTSEEVEDLLNNGPKNELFLLPGQAAVFALNDGVNAQIGLKAPCGNVNYKISSSYDEITLNSSTDMFYHNLTGQIAIANTGDNILSITKLKAFNVEDAVFADVSVDTVNAALEMLNNK